MNNQRSIEKANSVSSMSPAVSNGNIETNGFPTNGKTTNGNYDNDNNNQDPEIRKKLIEFYTTHNPSKLKDEAAIKEVLRRYKGRETKLFADLNRKYNVTTDNDKDGGTTTNTLNQRDDDDDNIKKKESIGDDDDESKPLNGGDKKVKVDANASKIELNKKKRGTPISPQSRKKQLLASESPPESEIDEPDDDEQQMEINAHPMLADIQGDKSESVPINGGNNNYKKNKQNKNNNKTPTSPLSELRVEINGDKDDKDKVGKLVNVDFPSLKSNNSFKIEVTKPKKNGGGNNSFKNRKKINGTNLFGAQIGKSLSNGHRNSDQFGKPLFGNSTSNSYSNSRSTSFIAGSLDTPNGVDDLPKFGSNIVKSLYRLSLYIFLLFTFYDKHRKGAIH